MKVAFIGHRKIESSQKLKDNLMEIIKNLIVDKNADTFLFGSKSQFNDLCYQIVSDLKEKYNHIRRIYVRTEYQLIEKSYFDYLLKFYEDSYFPVVVEGAGKLSYIKRNQILVDSCDLLLVYCDENYNPKSKCGKSNSGTKMAVEYAKKKHVQILNLLDM